MKTAELHRLGVVSFLNARPLVEGLDAERGVSLTFDVPSALPALLDTSQVDAALVPVIDLVRPGRSWKIVSDACIGCNGETLTVRIFSRIPPEQITRLHVDGDSHTSVALATVIWQEMFGRRLFITPFRGAADLVSCEALLLIGDKVVTSHVVDLDIQIDLGGAWKSLTGLPFVFAVWAAQSTYSAAGLARLLAEARDRGVANVPHIAAEAGPHLGWPVALAERYLGHRLNFRITPEHRRGLETFLEKVQQLGLVPNMQEPVFA
jgi:chorismate dehydratase